MANHHKIGAQKRLRKTRSVRNRITGTPERPRLAVYRSSKFIYAQVIDDSRGHTLAAASELEPTLKDSCAQGTKIEAAKVVGKAIAERLKAKGVSKVVFDRRWYVYHGRIKALADAAREGGLQF